MPANFSLSESLCSDSSVIKLLSLLLLHSSSSVVLIIYLGVRYAGSHSLFILAAIICAELLAFFSC